MSVTEVQTGLPTPPTGIAIVTTEHEYNPHKGFYEPSLKNIPVSASVVATAVGANLIAGLLATGPVWIYAMVFANGGAAVTTCTLTEPGGRTYVVRIPANDSIVIVSNPYAPLFISTAAGNLTATDALATTTVTVTYVVK